MEHILNPLSSEKHLLEDVFKIIAAGNTILFLGAGASVSDKRYLSKQIIEYYEDKIGKHFDISNITEFVDILSENPWFNRSNEFDGYVYELLSKLSVTDIQRVMLSNPWRQIITTNFDLLVEKADYELKEQSKNPFDLFYVRNVREYHHTCDNNQIKYIKLNGCMTDKGRYPFVFSSEDFKAAKNFYRTVLEDLKNLSDKITFLAVGYSFSDHFSKQLLEKFDSYNYRDKKWMWNIDPHVSEHKLPYFKKNKISIIKCTVEEFFSSYKKWEEKEYGARLKKVGGITFTNSKKVKVKIGNKLAYNLRGVIEQLNENSNAKSITEDKFYKGEEPTYNVIERGYDVIRSIKLKQIKDEVQKITSQHHTLVPIIFLTGNFGTGKTTLNYRLIHQLINETDQDFTAFEILDIDRVRREDIRELIESIRSKQIIFYCNNVEIDSVYKSIIDLRTFISTLQISEVNIFFLLSIRENILAIHKKSRDAKSTYQFNVDSKLNRGEIEDLLEKLKRNGFIDFRDTLEKTQIVSKIESQYGGDPFITLLNIVTNGRHIENLRDAYYQLSKACRKAFVYTALVHQHNLHLPASALKNLVSTDWEDFRNNVINVEGRGILIQEDLPFSKGTDPDLYFRTKHPIIANKLIKEIHPREEKRFSLYKELVESMTFGARNSKFLVNLFKAIRTSKEFNESRIDQLFDISYRIFSNEPFFLLHYAINLQNRGSKVDIETAIEKINYAETLLDYRNDKFIHRKGSLYFKLAKIYYNEEKSTLNLTFKYLDEAKDWLYLKQQLDPCSSFSYADLLELLIWELDRISFNDVEQAKKQINIEDYFDLALNAVTDDLGKILELREKYELIFYSKKGDKDYLLLLETMYDDVKLRPFACILLYNYYSKANDEEKIVDLLEEIETYQDEDEIAKFLFKYYGRNLSRPNIRMKFFRLSRKMDWYAAENPLRFNYYNYVAESYNMQMYAAGDYLNKILDKYQFINPEFQRAWEDPDTGEPRLFLGKVGKSKRGFKVFRCPDFPFEIWFVKNGVDKLNYGDPCSVNIYFFLSGLRAVLADKSPEEAD